MMDKRYILSSITKEDKQDLRKASLSLRAKRSAALAERLPEGDSNLGISAMSRT